MTDFRETPAGRRLIRAGLMDEPTGATRRARAVRCESCHRAVMRGICADYAGYVVDADPTPLSRTGEALALMAGRTTVELRWLTDRYELDLRDHFRIRGSPAGTNGIDVLVVHSCELSEGQTLPQMNSTLRDDKVAIPMPELPPF